MGQLDTPKSLSKVSFCRSYSQFLWRPTGSLFSSLRIRFRFPFSFYICTDPLSIQIVSTFNLLFVPFFLDPCLHYGPRSPVTYGTTIPQISTQTPITPSNSVPSLNLNSDSHRPQWLRSCSCSDLDMTFTSHIKPEVLLFRPVTLPPVHPCVKLSVLWSLPSGLGLVLRPLPLQPSPKLSTVTPLKLTSLPPSDPLG